MAKGARSSVRKTNNQNLKSRVFGPVEDARTARLSQKLLDLASQPKPARDEMEVEQVDDTKAAETEAKETEHADDTAMDVDGAKKQPRKPLSKTAAKKKVEERREGVQKRRHRKSTNAIAFTKKQTGKSKKR